MIGEELYINEVVFSEVAYIFLRIASGKSYNTLRKDRGLVSDAAKKFAEHVLPLLKLAEFLEVKQEVIEISGGYMIEYGLLPNDALILATCKHYRLDAILSLDRDFEEACRKEGILLLSSLGDLERI